MDQTHSSAEAFGRPANVRMNIFRRALKAITTLLNPRAYKAEINRYEVELRQRKEAK